MMPMLQKNKDVPGSCELELYQIFKRDYQWNMVELRWQVWKDQ